LFSFQDVNNNAFEPGQLVVLVNDENRVRLLQKGSGGWLEAMQKVIIYFGGSQRILWVAGVLHITNVLYCKNVDP